MNKKETADALGVSTKTVERLVSEGKLNPIKVHGPTGLQNEFDGAEVEALRRERETPIREARPTEQGRDETPRDRQPQTSTLATRRDTPAGLLQLLEMLSNSRQPPRAATVSIESKMFLSIKEAAALSGLGVSHLEDAIKRNKLRAYSLKGTRGRRIKRQDLDAYAKKL